MKKLNTWQKRLFGSLVLFALCAARAQAVQDVMLQTMESKIVTGIVDDQTGIGTLGTRVYRGNFLSNFRAANPGFFSLTSVNPNLPEGAAGFPSNHDVGFDLLPMHVAGTSSNLLYWDGSDPGGDGLDLADIQFVTPTNVAWEVFDDNSNSLIAAGTDEIVPGGLIQQTSSDTNPSDGIDTGMLHKHLALLLNSTVAGTPPAGVYMIAWQAQSAGFETSDPFVFVHRTSTVSNEARDLAAIWVEENIDALFSVRLPGDYNDDHVVDAADYTVWRDALGLPISLPNEDASPNAVDAEDYDVWKSHFGQSASDAAAAISAANVPEPATALISATAALALSLTTWRTRRAHRALESARPQR